MEKLRDLNGLSRGIYKHWIWGNDDNYHRICDYLQKVSYSIQDLNAVIENLPAASMKEVVFVIVLVDWICEAVNSIQDMLKRDVLSGFIYKKDKDIRQAKEYFKAVRSFVVAHPLNTNRHKDYGLDGDLICVDIRRKTSKVISSLSNDADWFRLNFDGLKACAKDTPSDFVLYVYSHKRDGMQFFKYVGVDFSDLYYVARLQIDKLYALGKHLESVKQKGVIK